jgi:hypothetical protein
MQNALLYISIGNAVLVLVVFVWLVITNKRINTLTRGNSNDNLETIIKDNNKLISDVLSEQESLHTKITDLRSRLRTAVQKVKVLRFNPFKEMGGNQSFSMAILDEDDNGIVVSSLYARDSVNIFAKPIKNGTSEHKLTEEEQTVITS